MLWSATSQVSSAARTSPAISAGLYRPPTSAMSAPKCSYRRLNSDLCPEGFANFTAFIRRLPSFELRDFRKDNLHFIKCQLVQAGKEDRLFLCVAFKFLPDRQTDL